MKVILLKIFYFSHLAWNVNAQMLFSSAFTVHFKEVIGSTSHQIVLMMVSVTVAMEVMNGRRSSCQIRSNLMVNFRLKWNYFINNVLIYCIFKCSLWLRMIFQNWLPKYLSNKLFILEFIAILISMHVIFFDVSAVAHTDLFVCVCVRKLCTKYSQYRSKLW